MSFDPNATGLANSGLFALPYSQDQSQLVVIPVPWEVTTSYGDGTALGPATILQSSHQMDLCDGTFNDFYHKGIFMQPVSSHWFEKNLELKKIAKKLQRQLENGIDFSEAQVSEQTDINNWSEQLNTWLENEAETLLKVGKIPAVVGGDHSSPFGLIKALKNTYNDLSILHIDAHMDFRQTYQGYTHSHASIMRNVHEQIQPNKIIQLGIRDFCPEEREYGAANEDIVTFFDGPTQLQLHQGENWYSICEQIVGHLSDNVYISFDIDGMEPGLCPNTGTPVPGGLSFEQINSLFVGLLQSKKNVVGFDLCEVSPPEGEIDCWDGNVGARILYKLCGLTLSKDR